MTETEIWLRSKLRKLGVTRHLHPHRAVIAAFYRRRYNWRQPTEVTIGFTGRNARMKVHDVGEYVTLMSKKEDAQFMRLLSTYLASGECFWDVGSNIGFYAVLAAQCVGEHGSVVAFEPEPATRVRLANNVSLNGARNVSIIDFALGREAGTFLMEAAADPAAGVHRLMQHREDHLADATTISVEVRPGDSLPAEVRRPNAVKIDVEGAELDVIQGMSEALRDPKCRALFCEVHFGQLEARGTPNAPREIEELLRHLGFSHQRWVDPSHLFVTKS